MATTFEALAKTVLTTTQATVTFSSIDSTYKDLYLVVSARADTNDRNNVRITFNSTSSNYSETYIYGVGTTAASARVTAGPDVRTFFIPGSTSTANTFSNNEIYIPNYTAAINKQMSATSVQENNSTTSNFIDASAFLWSNTAAISSISFSMASPVLFVSGSSFYLYGIKNS